MYENIRNMRNSYARAGKETHTIKRHGHYLDIYKSCSIYLTENASLDETEHDSMKELGYKAHIQTLIINAMNERDKKKRIVEYEKGINEVKNKCEAEKNKGLKDFLTSTIHYFKGRKLVDEAMQSEPPNKKLIEGAIKEFGFAKNRCKQANMCCEIYTVLFELDSIEVLNDDTVSHMKVVLQHAIERHSDKMDYNVKSAFYEIDGLLDRKNLKTNSEMFDCLNTCVTNINYCSLREYFGHISRNIQTHLEESFIPEVRYNNWRLDIRFDEPEKVQGKLTIKAGDEPVPIYYGSLKKSLELPCEFTIPKYYPETKKETLTFTDQEGGRVKKDVYHYEKISHINGDKSTHDAYFTRYDCKRPHEEGMFNIAIVQLKYHLNKRSSALVIDADDAYRNKITEILEAVRGKANIVVFPEFSIPFDYLDEMQTYSDNSGITIVAGSHYVTAENIPKYNEMFQDDIGMSDLLKNISPIIIPSSKKVLHTEKILPAKEERELFNEKGMKNGTLNRVFKLNDHVTFGVMICFDFMNPELRTRFNRACDIILVPQANPGTKRFHDIGENSIGNTDGEGNKTYIMASAIFTYDGKEGIMGGNSGAIPTLDGATFKKRKDTIIEPIKVGQYKVHEQFIQLASLDMDFITARDAYTAQTPITCKLIHIFEKNEILKSEKDGKNPTDFIELLETIKSCNDEEILTQLLIDRESLIYNHSPRMHKTLMQTPSEYKKEADDTNDKKDVWKAKTNPEKIKYNLTNLNHDQIKDKCAHIVLN